MSPQHFSEATRRRAAKAQEKQINLQAARHKPMAIDQHNFEPLEIDDEEVELLPDALINEAYERKYTAGPR